MAATGYTQGDPRKVSVAGDTMTGDLLLSGANTDLTVGGITTIHSGAGFTTNAGEALTTTLSTGVLYGGTMSINAGNPTLIDISEMVGYVVDVESVPTVPTITRVVMPAQVGLSLDVTGTQLITWWLLHPAGTIVQQPTMPTPTQRRTHIVLGVTAQIGGTLVWAQSAYGAINRQPSVQLADLMASIGPFLIYGGLVTPAGPNLMINITAGSIFAASSSSVTDATNPHQTPVFAQTPATFVYATRSMIGTIPRTTLDVANYNPTTDTVSPIGGGANTTAIHRVFALPTKDAATQLVVQYAQVVYGSLSSAVAAIGTGTYEKNPTLSYGVLVCYIAATRTATNLANANNAAFTIASPFARQ